MLGKIKAIIRDGFAHCYGWTIEKIKDAKAWLNEKLCNAGPQLAPEETTLEARKATVRRALRHLATSTAEIPANLVLGKDSTKKIIEFFMSKESKHTSTPGSIFSAIAALMAWVPDNVKLFAALILLSGLIVLAIKKWHQLVESFRTFVKAAEAAYFAIMAWAGFYRVKAKPSLTQLVFDWFFTR